MANFPDRDTVSCKSLETYPAPTFSLPDCTAGPARHGNYSRVRALFADVCNRKGIGKVVNRTLTRISRGRQAPRVFVILNLQRRVTVTICGAAVWCGLQLQWLACWSWPSSWARCRKPAKQWGFNRDSFYRFKELYDTGGRGSVGRVEPAETGSEEPGGDGDRSRVRGSGDRAADVGAVRVANERTHQGWWCFGKTAKQTFSDSLTLAKEKLISRALQQSAQLTTRLRLSSSTVRLNLKIYKLN